MSKKILVLDADSIIYANAGLCQKQTVTVRHLDLPDLEMEFDKISDFKGVAQKDEFLKKGWLFDENQRRIANEEKPLSIDDFEITTRVEELEKVFGINKPAFQVACEYTITQIENVRKNCIELLDLDEDNVYLKIVIGGKGNYRFDIFKDYKAGRATAPIRLKDLKKFVLDTYGNDVIIANDMEADDILGIYGWWGFNIAGKERDKDASPIILCHIDKDILQVPGWHYNYSNKEKPIWMSKKLSDIRFLEQVLAGDKTDNIKGLPKIHEDWAEHFEVRKGGCGKVKAKKILSQTDGSVKDMLINVIGLYEYYYTDNLKNPDVDWKSELQTQFQLLRLKEEKDVIPCVFEFCKRYEVDLENWRM